MTTFADTDDLAGSSVTLIAPSTGDVRRQELATFLRSRRERIRPEDVGLAPGLRRRTPGLRREELALLAGVGVTWYTWLEQGRDINVSPQVLDAVGRALRLDRFEQSHLNTLAGVPTSPAEAQCASLSPRSLALLRKLSPYPAVITSERMDLLAYNDAYRHLLVDLDEIPVEERNSLWLMFTHEEWRRGILQAEDACPRMVATFRAAMARHLDDPTWQLLVDRLLARSAPFAALWKRHDIAPSSSVVKLLQSPRVGLLRMESTNLWVSLHGGTRLVVYSPVDDETAARLDRLVGPC